MIHPSVSDYVVVHLVVQESTKPLICSQVVDHMQEQASARGEDRPADVLVAFLEPVRVALRSDVRLNVRSLRRRAPRVTIAMLPYVSRWAPAAGAAILRRYIGRWAKGRRVVFHCRGERAVDWARAFSRYVTGVAIVADIRGPWPEEMLYARGATDLSTADSDIVAAYRVAVRALNARLAASHHAVTVSDGMCDWLVDKGVSRACLTYVPCCVARVTHDTVVREEMRERLGLSRKVVLAYSGVVNRFQYLTEGLGDFLRLAMLADENVHFLGLTPDTESMSALLAAAGVDRRRATIFHLSQPLVPNYLSAADAGLILGTPSTLKSVTQPVKFGDYLAAGLPVVASRGARGMDALIAKYGAGILIDYDGDRWVPEEVASAVRIVQTDSESLRQGALTLCREHLVWSRYTDDVRRAYRDALANVDANSSCLDHDSDAALTELGVNT